MKQTLRCPKCQSTDIVANVFPLDLSDGSLQYQRKGQLAVYRKPSAVFFKGRQSTTMSAYVCADCGYVEFYADDPKALKIREEKWK
jgi:predicted nucleic-acid-binding Zn-ribbon protein